MIFLLYNNKNYIFISIDRQKLVQDFVKSKSTNVV